MTTKSLQVDSLPFLSVRQLFLTSWQLVQTNGKSFLVLWFILFLTTVLSIGISIAVLIAGSALVAYSSFALIGKILIVCSLLLFLVAMYVMYWGNVAHFYLAWLVVQKKPIGSWKSLYRESNQYIFPYIWTAFLYGVLIAIGLLFLFVPGILFAFLFGFSQFVVFAEHKKGFQALKRAHLLVVGQKQLVARRWLGLVGVHVLLYIIQMVTSFIPGVGIVVSIVGGVCLYFVSTVYGFLLLVQTQKQIDEQNKREIIK